MHLRSIHMHASSPLPHPQSGEASFRFEEQQPQIREKREGGSMKCRCAKTGIPVFRQKDWQKNPLLLFLGSNNITAQQQEEKGET